MASEITFKGNLRSIPAGAAITLQVKVAWWVRWYIRGVATFAQTFGLQPDYDKVLATVMRGIKVVPA